MATAERGPAYGAAFAALVAFGLGVVCAVMTIAGHPPWEGPEAVAIFGSHGLHDGDVVAVIPLIAGTWLAAWCWRRR